MENNRAKEIIQQSQLKDREDDMKQFTITEIRTMSAKWTYTVEAESEAEAMDQFLENADIEPDEFILEPMDDDEVSYEVEEIKDLIGFQIS